MFYPLWVFLRILVTFFWPVFCRTSHNLICNKFAILKNKKLTKILEVGKFSSYVTSYQPFFISDKTFYPNANISNSYNLMLKTHDWHESYETPFLYRGNMPKLICSFRVNLKSTFYGTSKFLLALYFCEALLKIVQVNRSMRNTKQ